MFIERGERRIEVPDNFLNHGHVFGRERLAKIIEMSGLSQYEFAVRHGFTYYQVTSWLKKKNSRNPNTQAKITLVFLEEELLRK